jgi:hypothetical protein
MNQPDLFDVGPRLLNAARRPLFVNEPPIGKPYQPSNGTEGMMFMERWCDNCKHQGSEDAEDWCMIMLRTMAHNPKDAEYPVEWRIGSDHQPECTAFEEEE